MCALIINLHLAASVFADCEQEPTNVSKTDCAYLGEGSDCSETEAAINLWCKPSTPNSKCIYVMLNPDLTVPTVRSDGTCEYDNGVLRCMVTSATSSSIITNVKTIGGTCAG